MDDKKLLEAAARAAGIDVQHMALSGFNIVSGPDAGKIWNPLTDDGDALRLAVKLGLHFAACDHSAIASVPDGICVQIAYGDDRYASTRRAIVRAAAAMGGPTQAAAQAAPVSGQEGLVHGVSVTPFPPCRSWEKTLMEKRCFTTGEAQQYLGLKRRFFDTRIAPLLAGKGIPAGTAIVYEREDLDAAWDRYKLSAGNGRPAQPEGQSQWDVPKRKASTPPPTAPTRSTPTTVSSAFENAVSRGMKMRKHS